MPKVTQFDDAQTALDKLHGNYTVDNVEEALVVLSNEERGRFVVGLFDEGVPADVLRPAIANQQAASRLFTGATGSRVNR